VVIGVLDWELSAQEAINLPRTTNRNDYTSLEKDTALEAIAPQLTKRGHNVRVLDLNSGLHAVEVKNNKLYGGADPRREGVALSDLTDKNAPIKF